MSCITDLFIDSCTHVVHHSLNAFVVNIPVGIWIDIGRLPDECHVAYHQS